MTPLVVGNWKMHGGPAACVELARAIVGGRRKERISAEIALAPPFTGLAPVKKTIGKNSVKLAAQNCYWQDSGAFTGEISPAMLAEIGCDFVIIGHSERRHLFGEDDKAVAQKLPAVIRHGMRPILCVGETLEERQSDRTRAVIARQLDSALKGLAEGDIEKVEIAYEPVWAIGTGKNATPKDAAEVHKAIRAELATRGHPGVRILYGGSVNEKNIGSLLAEDEINGVLVGGASLDPEGWARIVETTG